VGRGLTKKEEEKNVATSLATDRENSVKEKDQARESELNKRKQGGQRGGVGRKTHGKKCAIL